MVMEGDGYVTAKSVLEYFGISRMTLWRWVHDPDKPFPAPVKRGETRYWVKSEIRQWEANWRAERDAA